MLKIFTRRELYDLVWARPMTKIAAELGISDVALHKICAKHRIPAPGRGYVEDIRGSIAPEKIVPMLEKHRLMDDEAVIDSWTKF